MLASLASLAHKCIFQVVQEYERAVIFRLGRLLSGGSRGPGKYYQPLYRSTQVHILKTGCLLLPLILLKEILGGKKKTFFEKKRVESHHNSIAIFELSGIIFVLPCVENYTKVDLRTSAIDIPPQEVCARLTLQLIDATKLWLYLTTTLLL